MVWQRSAACGICLSGHVLAQAWAQTCWCSVCRPSWRPSELPALPPKLIFFGEYRERCADAQPHIRTAWVVTRIYVNYDTRTQGVTASVHDQDFAMTLTNAMGMPLEPWDLHVGAVLNILDRRVTLRGADLAVCAPTSAPLAFSMFHSSPLYQHCSVPGSPEN